MFKLVKWFFGSINIAKEICINAKKKNEVKKLNTLNEVIDYLDNLKFLLMNQAVKRMVTSSL